MFIPLTFNLASFFAGEYVCEIETYGSPMHQTSRLEILGEYVNSGRRRKKPLGAGGGEGQN